MEDLQPNDYFKIIGSILGLAVALIAIVKYVDYLKEKKIKKWSQMPIEKIDSDDVTKEFDKMTPYQQQDFKSSYIGLKVKWRLSYIMMHRWTPFLNFYNISFDAEGGEVTNRVSVDLNIKKFPMLKSANRYDLFEITGIIKSVTTNKIKLKVIELKTIKTIVVA